MGVIKNAISNMIKNTKNTISAINNMINKLRKF